jgi:ribosomal protein S18 acetylase RimI-like enzyme
MLTYEPADSEQYDEFLQMFREHTDPYIDDVLKLMDLNWERFVELFRTHGHVYGIWADRKCAGFYWIEERERILHIHALILNEEFQGMGIGGQTLKRLETEYMGKVDSIELGVHKSNNRAMGLYERSGFKTVKALEDLGFYVMQKDLRGRTSTH